MLLNLNDLPAGGAGFDVVVIGAGGAGMAAALAFGYLAARHAAKRNIEPQGETS